MVMSRGYRESSGRNGILTAYWTNFEQNLGLAKIDNDVICSLIIYSHYDPLKWWKLE